MSCIIMGDSTCDFSNFQAKVEGVRVVPFHYTDAKGSFSGGDDLFASVTPHEFYNAIRSGARLMTSQPSQLEFEGLFRGVGQDDQAVLFCISSGISGGYNGACMALDRLAGEDPAIRSRIFIVDTLLASTPLHLLVHDACRMRDAGASASEVAHWALEARWRAQTLFMVDSLDSLARGGRIPKGVAAAGDKLQVKPLLDFDLQGELSMAGIAHGRRKGLARLEKNFSKNHVDGSDGLAVAIGDADCPADGDALADALAKRHPGIKVLRHTIGPTIGCHVGPGMVSCCFWGADRRETA